MYIVLSVLVPIILCNLHNAQCCNECLSGVHICLQQCIVTRAGSKYASTTYIYIVNGLFNGFDINGVPEIELQLAMYGCIVAMLIECERMFASKASKKNIRAVPLFRTFLWPYGCITRYQLRALSELVTVV